MIFTATKLDGVFVVDLDPRQDERGFFARAWCEREFTDQGLIGRVAQVNVSYNARRGTLRGMHYQTAPRAEAKLIRCTRGAIYDVIIDLRPGSRTLWQWMGIQLSAETRRMLYVPEHCAHGFLTLADDTEVTYQVSEFYSPEYERGVRFDDPSFGIQWPEEVRVISEKDRLWPDHSPVDPAGSVGAEET